ncbi:hypothetical protein V7787_44145 [Pseudomonas sp. CGJS7]
MAIGVGMAAVVALLVSVWFRSGNRADSSAAVADRASGAPADGDLSAPPRIRDAVTEAEAGANPDGAPGAIAQNRSSRALERSFLEEGRINQRATDALRSQRFDQLMTQFERENADAVELTGAYRSELRTQLDALPGSMRLDRFACGIELCMGAIRSAAGSREYRAWYAKLQGSSRLPIPALTEATVGLGEDEEHRFLFSIRPGANAIGGDWPRRR